MHLELLILGLLVVVAGLAAVARAIDVPYPILLVIGGLGLGYLPGVPDVALDPDIVLLIFLPPLLYAAAFFNNPRELARNARPIGLLAIGLVVATTAGVAVVGHVVVGLDWPLAFVLGAIVSPTDVVAPAAIVRRLGVPRRLVTIIEGENLTNDWTALTFYKFAVAAVASGTFSLAEAAPKFLLTGLGGIAVGLLTGWLLRELRRRIDDAPTEITISLFTGYAAYLPAEELGLSGVMATVTVGLYMGWYASELTTAATRLQLQGIWGTLEFLLNAVLFVLVGLQLPTVLDGLSGESTGQLIGYGAAIGAAVVLLRLAWVFAVTYAPGGLSAELRAEDPGAPSWRATLVVAWCSMRGSVALAAALALPETIRDGAAPFPERDLIIFLTYAVILATLVVQGLTLPTLIRRLGVRPDDLDAREELIARKRAAEAAMERIDELVGEDWVRDATAERLRGLHEFRHRRFSQRAAGDGTIDERSERYQRLMHEIIGAERRAILELRNRGQITDEVMRRVQRDLDLEEARLEV